MTFGWNDRGDDWVANVGRTQQPIIQQQPSRRADAPREDVSIFSMPLRNDFSETPVEKKPVERPKPPKALEKKPSTKKPVTKPTENKLSKAPTKKPQIENSPQISNAKPVDKTKEAEIEKLQEKIAQLEAERSKHTGIRAAGLDMQIQQLKKQLTQLTQSDSKTAQPPQSIAGRETGIGTMRDSQPSKPITGRETGIGIMPDSQPSKPKIGRETGFGIIS